MHCLSCEDSVQKIFLLNWVLYYLMVWLTRKCNGLTRSDRVGKEMRAPTPFIDHPPPFLVQQPFDVGILSRAHCIRVSWHHLKSYHTLFHHCQCRHFFALLMNDDLNLLGVFLLILRSQVRRLECPLARRDCLLGRWEDEEWWWELRRSPTGQ